MTEIFYNSINPFSGIAPTPRISINKNDIKEGERWGVSDSITLIGDLTGDCVKNNTGLFEQKNKLLEKFTVDFKFLEIIENNTGIYFKPYCKVENISFGRSDYVGILPFTINLQTYDQNFFSGYYGVVEPNNSFVFTENPNKTIQIQHTCSARGFNTNSNVSNSVDNARQYVSTISGWNNQVLPFFIDYCSGLNPCLRTIQENINRLNGLYSLVETYIVDPNNTGDGILRYQTQFNSGIESNVATLAINGQIEGCKNRSFQILRDRYSGFDIFSAAVNAYEDAVSGDIQLNPIYVTSGIVEDNFAKLLTFNVTFNNDPTLDVFFDYNIGFDKDFLSDIVTATFNGIIKGKGDLKTRWERVQAFNSGVDIFLLTQTEYVNQGYGFALNPKFLSKTFGENEFLAEITLGGSWNDKNTPVSGLESFDYTLSLTPSIRQYSSVPCLDGEGEWYVTDLGYTNRAIFSIQGSSVISSGTPIQSGVQIIRNQINYLSALHSNGPRKVLDNQQITKSNSSFERQYSFSAQWSYEDNEFIV